MCTDTWRPAAYEQLRQLTESLNVPLYGDPDNKEALDLADLVTKNNIFHVLHNTKESNLYHYLLNTLEDYLKSRKKFSFSKKSSEKFIDDLIK